MVGGLFRLLAMVFDTPSSVPLVALHATHETHYSFRALNFFGSLFPIPVPGRPEKLITINKCSHKVIELLSPCLAVMLIAGPYVNRLGRRELETPHLSPPLIFSVRNFACPANINHNLLQEHFVYFVFNRKVIPLCFWLYNLLQGNAMISTQTIKHLLRVLSLAACSATGKGLNLSELIYQTLHKNMANLSINADRLCRRLSSGVMTYFTLNISS